jgi:hypothetical protein
MEVIFKKGHKRQLTIEGWRKEKLGVVGWYWQQDTKITITNGSMTPVDCISMFLEDVCPPVFPSIDTSMLRRSLIG